MARKRTTIRVSVTGLDGAVYEGRLRRVDGERSTVDGEQATVNSQQSTACPYAEIRDLYNRICARAGMRVCRELRPEYPRGKAVARLWKDHPDLKWWQDYFILAARSSFLCGKNKPGKGYERPFRADLGYLVEKSTVEDVIDHKYIDEGSVAPNASRIPVDELKARLERLRQMLRKYEADGVCEGDDRVIGIRRSIGDLERSIALREAVKDVNSGR